MPAICQLRNGLDLFNWHPYVKQFSRLLATAFTHSEDKTHHQYDERPYNELLQRSIEQPTEFWASQAEKLTWFKKWDRVLDNTKPPFTQWFVGGELNVCYNALDRHVKTGRGGQLAIIYDSPITQTIKRYTYAQLLDEVSRFAGVLARHAIIKGDRVLIYMPMIPEAIIAMLACARVGAIHSVVFGGFSAKELSSRINHCEAKLVVTASAGVEPKRVQDYKPIVDQAIAMSNTKPQTVIIYQRPNIGNVTYEKGRDFSWDQEMQEAVPHRCVSVSATDPLYILYTSGTTGLPKGIVRPTGGHAVTLPWTMQTVYGMSPGETWWGSSDLGWVVGHSYICYGPLLYGLTTLLYEGKPIGTPDPGQYFRVISQHEVRAMFCAPTALRAIRQADYNASFGEPFKRRKWLFRTLFAAGEHLDYDTRVWAQEKFGVPVLDHWWQTESGSPITATCVGCLNVDMSPPKDASGKPVPGWNVMVVDIEGKQLPAEQLGQIVVKQPLPPGSLSTLWRNDEKFAEIFFKSYPGFYDTQDSGFVTKDGHICVMSRSDDVINVAGHRISGGAVEETILKHKTIADCAVVGIADELKGSVPVAFVVVRDDFSGDKDVLCKEVVDLVRQDVGPVAAFKKVLIVPKLPKTRSGKTARGTLHDMCNGKQYKIPVTIEDASVYPAIKEAIEQAKLCTKVLDPL